MNVNKIKATEHTLSHMHGQRMDTHTHDWP